MERRETTINGSPYRLDTMKPFDAAPFSLRVLAILSTAVESVLEGDISLLHKFINSKEDVDLDETEILQAAKMFMKIIPKLDKEEVSSIFTEALSSNVLCPKGKLNQDLIFDSWFQEHPGDYYPIALWATWEHSKDFLLGAQDGIREVFLGPVNKSQSPSQTNGDSIISSQECVPPIVPIPTLKKGR